MEQMKTKAKSPRRSLAEMLDSWAPIAQDFPEIEELPIEPVELKDVDPGSEDAFQELMGFLASRRKR
jgi:hypothetical protein